MKITLVSAESGDWEGLYIDGIIKHQDYTISLLDFAEAVGLEVEQLETEELTALGYLPPKLVDVKST